VVLPFPSPFSHCCGCSHAAIDTFPTSGAGMPSARKLQRSLERREALAAQFRTTLCRTVGSSAVCAFGSLCKFAHDPNDLRTVNQNLEEGLTSKDSVDAWLSSRSHTVSPQSVSQGITNSSPVTPTTVTQDTIEACPSPAHRPRLLHARRHDPYQAQVRPLEVPQPRSAETQPQPIQSVPRSAASTPLFSVRGSPTDRDNMPISNNKAAVPLHFW
jgi:hypothetical protein